MSEPITLYRDGDEVTVYAPSVAVAMQAEGWTLEPEADDVPFSFHDEYDSTVRNPPFVEDEPEPAPEPKPRRGRKPKAQK